MLVSKQRERELSWKCRVCFARRSQESSRSVLGDIFFLCLAYTDQNKSPTCEADKDKLFRAGLGEKEISFEDVNTSQEEFHEIIHDHYPCLCEGGGFRFMKGRTCTLSLFGC